MRTKSIVAGIGLILSLADAGKAGLFAYWDYSNQSAHMGYGACAPRSQLQMKCASRRGVPLMCSPLQAPNYDANIDVTCATKNGLRVTIQNTRSP